MVAEPKPHQTGRKRQNIAKTGNDWDYYYDSYYTSTAIPPRLVPPLKRPRLMLPTRSQQQQQQQQQQQSKQKKVSVNAMQDFKQLKIYSNPDILICGNCREMFTDLGDLLEHKRDYCKLRFTCKCHTFSGATSKNSTDSLLCVLCKDSFPSAWELMVHAQASHMINIYEFGSGTKFSRRLNQNNEEFSESPVSPDQENKRSDDDEHVEEEELDGHMLLPSPDSGKSTDNENALSPIKIRSEVDESDHEEYNELIIVKNKNSSAQSFYAHRPIAIESTVELNANTNDLLSNPNEALFKTLTNGSITTKE